MSTDEQRTGPFGLATDGGMIRNRDGSLTTPEQAQLRAVQPPTPPAAEPIASDPLDIFNNVDADTVPDDGWGTDVVDDFELAAEVHTQLPDALEQDRARLDRYQHKASDRPRAPRPARRGPRGGSGGTRRVRLWLIAAAIVIGVVIAARLLAFSPASTKLSPAAPTSTSTSTTTTSHTTATTDTTLTKVVSKSAARSTEHRATRPKRTSHPKVTHHTVTKRASSTPATHTEASQSSSEGSSTPSTYTPPVQSSEPAYTPPAASSGSSQASSGSESSGSSSSGGGGSSAPNPITGSTAPAP